MVEVRALAFQILMVEEAKGEGWEQFCLRHGDWGRDAALWLGCRVGRLSLGELGELAGGMDYAAVGQAVARFDKRVGREAQLRQMRVRCREDWRASPRRP